MIEVEELIERTRKKAARRAPRALARAQGQRWGRQLDFSFLPAGICLARPDARNSRINVRRPDRELFLSFYRGG